MISYGRNAKLLLRIHRIPPLNVPMPQYRIIFRFQLPPKPSSPFMHIQLWRFRTEVKGRRHMRLGCYPETRIEPSRFPICLTHNLVGCRDHNIDRSAVGMMEMVEIETFDTKFPCDTHSARVTAPRESRNRSARARASGEAFHPDLVPYPMFGEQASRSYLLRTLSHCADEKAARLFCVLVLSYKAWAKPAMIQYSGKLCLSWHSTP